jgi:hypothetical protein
MHIAGSQNNQTLATIYVLQTRHKKDNSGYKFTGAKPTQAVRFWGESMFFGDTCSPDIDIYRSPVLPKFPEIRDKLYLLNRSTRNNLCVFIHPIPKIYLK